METLTAQQAKEISDKGKKDAPQERLESWLSAIRKEAEQGKRSYNAWTNLKSEDDKDVCEQMFALLVNLGYDADMVWNSGVKEWSILISW